MIDRRELKRARHQLLWGEDVTNARNTLAANIPLAETEDGLALFQAAMDALEEAIQLLKEANLLIADAVDEEEGETPSEQLALGD